MTTTMTMTTTSRSADCGCGGGGGGCGGGGCNCGGSPAVGSAAFTRPRFFAGQLLTEDDLEQLTAYITGKDRLRNRMLFGPGVVSGLHVVCGPCGGDIVVRPGYALDCCGNEIVVSCPETVSITELVNELRVRGLGVDCGDPCADRSTSGETKATGEHATRGPQYGLYVRYAEADSEPVAPYATQEPCPPVSCVPSRVREGFTFLVKCACADPPDHSYRPGDCLLRGLGDLPGMPPAFGSLWTRGRRLDQYRERMRAAAAAEDQAIVFKDADAARFTAALDELTGLMNGVEQIVPGTGTLEVARQITETVRALAAAVARYDLVGAPQQQRLLKRYPDLVRVKQARAVLDSACAWLRTTVTDPVAGSGDLPLPELTWPDPALRGIAHAVVEQTPAQVGQKAVRTPMELRLVALGAPLDRPLRADLRTDLGRLRDWLLIRLETSAELTTCMLRADVAGIAIPQALPKQAQGDDGTVTAGELKELAHAATRSTARCTDSSPTWPAAACCRPRWTAPTLTSCWPRWRSRIARWSASARPAVSRCCPAARHMAPGWPGCPSCASWPPGSAASRCRRTAMWKRRATTAASACPTWPAGCSKSTSRTWAGCWRGSALSRRCRPRRRRDGIG